MRNFWLFTDIDGRETKLRGGPLGKDGGFTQEIYQRIKGESQMVATVVGKAALNLDYEPYELILTVTLEKYPNSMIEVIDGRTIRIKSKP